MVSDNIPCIDYILLGRAVEYYQRIGYFNKHLPWIVDDSLTKETFPGESIKCQLGSMVGSAEQSFLSEFDNIGNDSYFSVTPCWRNEPVIDDIHFSYFMKLELFSKGNIVHKFIDDANELFSYYIKLEIVETGIGFDIVYNNIELGSYGTRLFNGKQYSYGTGTALPRLSYAIEHSIQERIRS